MVSAGLEDPYPNVSGSGFPPSLIPALWNIGLLHHKKVKLRNNMRQSVCQVNPYEKTQLLS